ncbi:MAG: hypothetical protein LBH29_07325 [Elusimicrobiota bacterium]|jgi:hypothetical protein|nr:hypothetical protein [Elusimicrobiota bacterium]
MKKIFFAATFALILAIYLSSCSVNFKTAADISKNAVITNDRIHKETIFEFPIIDYSMVSNAEKRMFNTADIPRKMRVSYILKAVKKENNQKLFFLLCAFTSDLIKGQDFKISRIYNKEEQLLNASFARASQDKKIVFSDIQMPINYLDGSESMLSQNKSNISNNYGDYKADFDENAPATIYYVLPLDMDYILSHKDSGIVIKVYGQGRYGRIYFHIAPFYIDGAIESLN